VRFVATVRAAHAFGAIWMLGKISRQLSAISRPHMPDYDRSNVYDAATGLGFDSMDRTPNRHFGVHGLIVAEGRVLLVRKTRGPYLGLLDLPGGKPEQGEDRPAALHREIAEETGFVVDTFGPWQDFRCSVSEDSHGRPIQFEHAGVWTSVNLIEASPIGASAELWSADTAGTIWLPVLGWRTRTGLSPLTKVALSGAGF